MSDSPAGPNPFEGWPMFGDLARMFSGQGPVNWDVARQTSAWIATEGQSEPNVDPLERLKMENLLRVADLQVSDAIGLSTSVSGGVLAVLPVTRGTWAQQTLEAFRPFLERLAQALAEPSGDEPATIGDPTTQLVGDLGRVLGPVLIGVQAGYMVGSLARRSLGQYDLLLPRPPADQLIMVPANLAAFAKEWELDHDDLRMWLCLREVTTHAVLGRPHVNARLRALIEEFAGGFQVNPDAFEQSLGELDPTDPNALQTAMGNPETLLGAVQTDAQQAVESRIHDLISVISAHVDHVMDDLGGRMIATYRQLTEALNRRRSEASDGERFAGRLMGLTLDRDGYERGQAFVRGVVERAGEDGLARLWADERFIPTPAEVDAPGLWLARIDLPEEETPS